MFYDLVLYIACSGFVILDTILLSGKFVSL